MILFYFCIIINLTGRKIVNYSFWEKNFIESPAEITIIGSGIVGLSTAISIKERNPNISVKILERSATPNGASTKNAGFSCFGSVSELLHDIVNMGEEACMQVVNMRWKGLEKLKNRVGLKNMEYKPFGGMELFRPQDETLRDKCFSNIDYCNELIYNTLSLDSCYQIVENTRFPTFNNLSIFNQYEGTINPMSMMNFLRQLCADLKIEIIYGIEVQNILFDEKVLFTHGNLHIKYNKLIICTNGFTKSLYPDIDVLPARNQVLITQPIPNLKFEAGYHVDEGYIYFRSYQNRILLGGGRNLDIEGETTMEFGNTANIQTYLLNLLETIYPGASHLVEHWWSGILGIGPSKFPIIHWHNDSVLFGVRLGGMGVAIGSYLGETLANEVMEN
jgi:glycine/D-amino acid oxidase-like deaminating enzyme